MNFLYKGIDSKGKFMSLAGYHVYYEISQNGLEQQVRINSLSFKLPVYWTMRELRKEYRRKKHNYRNRHNFQTREQLEIALVKEYENRMGRTPNLRHPVLLTEKINWMKLNYHDPMITKCCDKYRLKEYVSQCLGTEKHNIPLLYVWENVQDINFDILPESFVLKVNWSSGYNIFVRNKSSLSPYNKKKILKQLRLWLEPESNSYYDSFNWGYKDMNPVIYAEEYLTEKYTNSEYKFFVFNGKAKYILLEIKDEHNVLKRICLDINLKKANFTFGEHSEATEYHISAQFTEMLKAAELLALRFPFVRVDFLANDIHFYVGEMTFYSGGGFSKIRPEEWDKKLGDQFDIAKMSKLFNTEVCDY